MEGWRCRRPCRPAAGASRADANAAEAQKWIDEWKAGGAAAPAAKPVAAKPAAAKPVAAKPAAAKPAPAKPAPAKKEADGEKKGPLSFMFNKPKDPKPPAKLTPEGKAAPADAPAASDADANAAEAQKWIDEWKAGAPPAGTDVDANAAEAQKWIDEWKAGLK